MRSPPIARLSIKWNGWSNGASAAEQGGRRQPCSSGTLEQGRAAVMVAGGLRVRRGRHAQRTWPRALSGAVPAAAGRVAARAVLP